MIASPVSKFCSLKKATFKITISLDIHRILIVLEKKNRDFVNYYLLGDLYSLLPVSTSTFAYHELMLVDISYPKACYVDSINTASVLKVHDDLVDFQPKHCRNIYFGPKTMFD